MENIQSQVLAHLRTTCPEIPDLLAETTADLATHILESVKDTVIRISKTAPEPRLVGMLGIQLVSIWANAEVEAMKK